MEARKRSTNKNVKHKNASSSGTLIKPINCSFDLACEMVSSSTKLAGGQGDWGNRQSQVESGKWHAAYGIRQTSFEVVRK